MVTNNYARFWRFLVIQSNSFINYGIKYYIISIFYKSYCVLNNNGVLWRKIYPPKRG